MLFPNDDAGELEDRISRNDLPAIRHATTYTPNLPSVLGAGADLERARSLRPGRSPAASGYGSRSARSRASASLRTGAAARWCGSPTTRTGSRRSRQSPRSRAIDRRLAAVRRWLPLIILAAAQFVMVLDSSVMNVSISQIVADLDTTITGVQLAITMYTLVMAAFMLVGAKLGRHLGPRPRLRDRPRRLRARVVHDGDQPEPLRAALRLVARRGPRRGARDPGHRRPHRGQLRGEGAGLRVRDHRRRRRRIAIAVGPVIGGWVTTNYTWRYVFVGEVVIVIGILLVRNRMQAAPRAEQPPKLDLVGAALSALGLGLSSSGSSRAAPGAGSCPRARPRSTATRSRRSASRSCPS